MTEQTRRPQSRMVPALAAALVGVLLGALIVLTGVLAGQRGGCCCACNGPVCAQSDLSRHGPSHSLTPGRPYLLPPPVIVPPWVRPELQRHEVPLPGSLMLVGAGLLAWRLS